MELAAVRARARAAVTTVLREHGLPLAVLLLSTLYILAIGVVEPGVTASLWHLPSALLLVVVVVDLACVRLLWYRIQTRAPWRNAWRTLRKGPLTSSRLADLFVAAFLGRWVMLNAVGWKLTIPVVHPFAFDRTLAQLDAALHGQDPFRLLQVPNPVLRAVDAFYYGWFPIFAAVMLWWGWQPPSLQRRRFLLGMALLWTASAVLAVLVSSAGPIFYGPLTGDVARFAPAIQRLHELDLIAWSMQGALWNAYQGVPGSDVIAGIAAFPSVHVALPTYLALSSRGPVRWCFGAMSALTFVGSVALLWHYAVDGYAGVLLALLAWRVAGWAVRPRRPPTMVGGRELHEL